MREDKISMYDKFKILMDFRAKCVFLIESENNTSRRELYRKWKREVESVIDDIAEEKYELDKQLREDLLDYQNWKKRV